MTNMYLFDQVCTTFQECRHDLRQQKLDSWPRHREQQQEEKRGNEDDNNTCILFLFYDVHQQLRRHVSFVGGIRFAYVTTQFHPHFVVFEVYF